MEYARLNTFVEFASQSLPISVFIDASDRGTAAFLASSSEEIIFNLENLNRFVLHILFEAIMRSSSDKPDHRGIILAEIGELSHGLFLLHTSGHLPKNFHIDVDQLPQAVNHLVEPQVMSELGSQCSRAALKTLLSHFLLTKRTLRLSQSLDDVDNQNNCDLEAFLTAEHLSHLLFECLFIAHHSLVPCFRTVLAALAARPKWRRTLSREISDNLKSCPFKCVRHRAHLTVGILLRSPITRCFFYRKTVWMRNRGASYSQKPSASKLYVLQ